MASKILTSPLPLPGSKMPSTSAASTRSRGLPIRASSYWQSIMLAANRGEPLTIAVHYKQVIAVTREVCALVGALGSARGASL